MKIGILSDTHGDVERTALAARILKHHGATVVVHCGDIGSEGVLTELSSQLGLAGIPVHAVLGNVDTPELARFPASAGVNVQTRMAEIESDGKRIAVIHGDDIMRLKDAVVSGQYNYVLTGHTHLRSDTRIGTTRIINPGALHQAYPPSVAVLDVETGELMSLVVNSSSP
ncbi:MAG: YfcE family phosphodiesterase [bacterium]